eukprot:332156_1
MISFKSILLLLAAIIGSATACSNNSSYTFALDPTQPPERKIIVDCNYITRNLKKRAIRIQKFCPLHQSACQLACGLCVDTPPVVGPEQAPNNDNCVDSATHTFKVEYSGTMEKCSWLLKSSSPAKDLNRTNKYCANSTTKSQCARSCNFCVSSPQLPVPQSPCVNSSTHTFTILSLNIVEDCTYIDKNMKKRAIRRQKFCGANGIACPLACGYCTP